MLDWLLGKDEGLIYRRAELKELVTIHGNSRDGPLTKNEVTIIRGALDLQEKTALSVMTALDDVFAIDTKAVLDQTALQNIVDAGHSRVPVYDGTIKKIIGVILIKSLITLDPNEATPIRSLKMSCLPWVASNTPLYEMLDKFQEGSSKWTVSIQD